MVDPTIGIMAVLFSGIVMAHYTHYNLSPVTQVTIQQTLRSVAFMAGKSMPCNLPRDHVHISFQKLVCLSISVWPYLLLDTGLM